MNAIPSINVLDQLVLQNIVHQSLNVFTKNSRLPHGVQNMPLVFLAIIFLRIKYAIHLFLIILQVAGIQGGGFPIQQLELESLPVLSLLL